MLYTWGGSANLIVNSTGVKVAGNLEVTGSIVSSTTPLITSAYTNTATVSIGSIPSHNQIRVLLSGVGLNGANSVVLRVGTTSASAASIYSFTLRQMWSASQSTISNKNTTGMYLSGALNSNEALWGSVVLDKIGSGTDIEYVVSGLLKATNFDETIIYTLAGFIKTGYEISFIGLANPNSANTFNRSDARLQVTVD